MAAHSHLPLDGLGARLDCVVVGGSAPSPVDRRRAHAGVAGSCACRWTGQAARGYADITTRMENPRARRAVVFDLPGWREEFADANASLGGATSSLGGATSSLGDAKRLAG